MSVAPDQPSPSDVSEFSSRLVKFKSTLTPGEDQLFTAMMITAHGSLQNDDVVGYDAGDSDLASRIDWTTLTAYSIDPSARLDRPISDRQ